MGDLLSYLRLSSRDAALLLIGGSVGNKKPLELSSLAGQSSMAHCWKFKLGFSGVGEDKSNQSKNEGDNPKPNENSLPKKLSTRRNIDAWIKRTR